MKKRFKKTTMTVILVLLMVTMNCLTAFAQDVSVETQTQPEVTKEAIMEWIAGMHEYAEAKFEKAAEADHIDISTNVTARLQYNGQTYVKELTLTKDDFTASNISLTATQNENNIDFVMDLNTLSENKNIFGINQIRIDGTYPTGTLKNPVNYIFTLTKDVIFTDENGAEIATLPMTFTATFNYWMENNFCTELLNAEDIKQFWTEGFTIPGTGFGIEFEDAAGEKEYVPTETPDEEKPDAGTTEKPDEEKPDDGTTEKPDEEKPDDGTTEKPDEEKPDDGTTEKPDEEKPDAGTTEKPDEEKPDNGKDDQGTAKPEPDKYEADGSLAVYAKKNLKGRDLKAEEFQFKLEAVTEGAPMPKDVIAENEADGDIFFAAIAYDEDDIGKTYEYRMFELKGNLEKMTYDQSTYYFKITVKDAGNGKLEIKQSYVPTFYNEYASKAAAKTGDTTMVPYYLATALFCAVVVIVAVRQMRRDDQA